MARLVGYSVQQIRNLERDGVLPAASRSASGYRTYGNVHVLAAGAYRHVAAAVGPVDAKALMRAAHAFSEPGLLALLDAAHARLDAERRDVALAIEAAGQIADETIGDVRPSDTMTISELSDALGVRPSTLRHWDAVGLVVAHRSAPGGARRYLPADVRDARIVHQLRQAGYRIDVLLDLLPALRGSRRDHVVAALDARQASVESRSLAMLDATAALHALIARARRNHHEDDVG